MLGAELRQPGHGLAVLSLEAAPRTLRAEAGARGHPGDEVPLARRHVADIVTPTSSYSLVLQKVASELHPKVRNHGEGPY